MAGLFPSINEMVGVWRAAVALRVVERMPLPTEPTKDPTLATTDRQVDPDTLAHSVYLTMTEITLESGATQDTILPWSEGSEDDKQICRRIAEQVAALLEHAFKAKLDALQARLDAQDALVLELQGRLADGHRNHIDSWPL